MNIKKIKIIVTGGDGRFANILKKKNKILNLLLPSKKKLNILNNKSIISYLKLHNPKIVLHCAGLSRPMIIHSKNIEKSIDLNIIGTANITKACSKMGIKLIYFSTGYVYPGDKGNYKEDDPLKPSNNYAWSKLGGECAVQMYKNSLILRIIMTEKPFVHEKAFTDFITNFIFHEEIVDMLPFLIDQTGIINVGGKSQSVYKFAKKYNRLVKKDSAKGKIRKLKQSMNINKLKKIIYKKKNNYA